MSAPGEIREPVVRLHEAGSPHLPWTRELMLLQSRLAFRIRRALETRGVGDGDVWQLADGDLSSRFVYLPRIDSFALVNDARDGFAPTASPIGYVTVEEAVDRWLAQHPSVRDVYLTAEEARDAQRYRAAARRAAARRGRLITPGT